jgi:hypothetical protein
MEAAVERVTPAEEPKEPLNKPAFLCAESIKAIFWRDFFPRAEN